MLLLRPASVVNYSKIGFGCLGFGAILQEKFAGVVYLLGEGWPGRGLDVTVDARLRP